MIMTPLTTLAFAALAIAQQTDTTITVQPGARLDVSVFSGEIRVDTWSRNAIRIRADLGSRERLDIDGSQSSVRVRVRTVRGDPADVDFTITIPASLRLELRGVETDISVDGAGADVEVGTVSGDVTIRGGSGLVSLHTMEGDVILADASGRIDVGSVNGDVELHAVRGRLAVETVNGDVSLERIESDELEAATVSGDVTFDGTLADGGRHRLTTHNGDLTVSVPRGINAAVSVSTFNGEFESSFPVTLTEIRPGKRFSFTLGTGAARLELESFNGTIQLQQTSGTRREEP
jgi:DUF4097 and DUF4098 domain-containing protein YvlB